MTVGSEQPHAHQAKHLVAARASLKFGRPRSSDRRCSCRNGKADGLCYGYRGECPSGKRTFLYVMSFIRNLKGKNWPCRKPFPRASTPREIVSPVARQLSRHWRDNCARWGDEPDGPCFSACAARPGQGLRRPRRRTLWVLGINGTDMGIFRYLHNAEGAIMQSHSAEVSLWPAFQ
jgi:hypothetical protein